MTADGTGAAMPDVSLVLVTYNRLGFLQRSLGAVLQQADLPCEVIVWNNASTDGTTEWLGTVTDPRVRVVNHSENIGCNAYERGLSQARGQWLVEMDDDVLELPERFLSRMVHAFEVCEDLGYLALDVVRDEKTNGRKLDEYAYTEETHGDVVVQFGAVGGWCAMTPRGLYEQVHFPLIEGATYFYEDGAYCNTLAGKGYRAAILKGVQCYHAAGVWWNAAYADYYRECHVGQPEEVRKLELFLERGTLIKDTQRPWTLRKLAGDARRWVRGLLQQ